MHEKRSKRTWCEHLKLEACASLVLCLKNKALVHFCLASPQCAPQILDMAVSLAKVADVDRNIGNEDVAIDGFQEAIKLLDSLILKSEEVGLEQRRLSVLEFLKNQLAEKQPDSTPRDHVSS